MKKICLFLAVLILLSLSACDLLGASPQGDEMQIDISDDEVHTTLPSGLVIDLYKLKGTPSTEPIGFEPVSDITREQILADHAEERTDWFEDNTVAADPSSRKVDLSGKELAAHEAYTRDDDQTIGSASVEVALDGDPIFTADAGDGGPMPPMQGLWSYDENWVLEYAYITMTFDEADNIASTEAVGQLVRNGVSINEEYAYDEAFGFQLLDGKPFYFYNADGQIGISFDENNTMLGFDEVLHYGCCSAGMLNPNRAKQMVSFFAEKDEAWYYVEMGIYD